MPGEGIVASIAMTDTITLAIKYVYHRLNAVVINYIVLVFIASYYNT
jgi:hypothetical protein